MCQFSAEQQKFLFSSTQNGWQTAQTFLEYIKEIVKEMRDAGIEGSIVIIADGFSGHSSIELQKFCNQNDVIFVILLPNATSLIQPLDVVVFKPVKTEEKKYKKVYKRIENKTELTEIDFLKILARVLKKVVTPDLVKKSFETTGLFPLNPKFRRHEYLVTPAPLSELTQSPQMPIILDYVELPQLELPQIELPTIASPSLNFMPQLVTDTPPMIHQTNALELPNNDLLQNIDPNDAESQMCLKVIQQQMNLLKSLQQKSSTSSALPPPNNSIADILKIPTIIPKIIKPRFKAKTHGIISSNEVITAFEEQQEEKEAEKERVEARKRARVEKREIAQKIKQENAAKKAKKQDEKASVAAQKKVKKPTENKKTPVASKKKK